MLNRSRLACFAVLLTAVAALAQSPAGPGVVKVTMSAADAWEKGMGGSGVQRDFQSGGIVLYDTKLVEDDGPGVGADADFLLEEDRSPTVPLRGATVAKKVLVVDRPEALEARVYAVAGLEVEVNGKAVGRTGGDKIVRFPPDLLRKGENVVILRAPAGANEPVALKISAREHILQNAPERKGEPSRSFTSADGGKTWTPVDGELVVRLSLRQHPAEGHLISPVIDLAQGEGKLPALANVRLQSVALAAQAVAPSGTRVELACRTGSTPVYDPAAWSNWTAPDAAKDARFLQWRAVLKTTDPRATPVLQGVALEAKVSPAPTPDWARAFAVSAARNEEIRYTNMPFEYEDVSNPKLVALRQKYRLDEVVKDGQTEFEKLLLLRNWVKAQWKYKPPTEVKYPAWDADEILTRKVGFCVQYAITYVQCCAALGYPARFVFGFHPGGVAGSGHEVTEVWSNELVQWVVMDPEGNRHYVDPRTGRPLSMLETHERMMKTYYGDAPASGANRPRSGKWSDLIATASGRELVPASMPTASDPPPRSWPAWSKWLNIRYVPRNNFYSKPAPLPRIQGWGGWEWPGFWAWYDEQTPRDWRYGNFTSRRSDLEWTINQVRFSAAWGAKPRTLAVQMGTVTPGFETFLVNPNGQGWKPAGKDFTWELAPGKNRLEMRVRTAAGVEGPISYIEVQGK